MTASPQTGHSYAGDEELNRLLAQSGAARDAAALRALLPGVLAAPPAHDPDAWMELAASAPSQPLRAQLRALRHEVEARGGREKAEADHAARIEALRSELKRRELAGFLIPRADEHQGEYVPPRAERLAWLTGFTGSAGLAIVLREEAAIFVDGRYTLQVEAEAPTDILTPRHLIDEPPHQWLEETLKPGQKLAYDPWLHSHAQVERLRKAVEKASAELVAVEENLVDAIWGDQPAAPIAPVHPHALAFAGKPTAAKLEEIAGTLKKRGAEAAVLTLPDSVAWLLNVRGSDVPRTPFALSFAVVHREEGGSVDWFVDRRKLVPGLEEQLGNRVSVRAPEELGEALDALGGEKMKVLADPASGAEWIFARLEGAGAEVVSGADPCQLPKARKNEVELEGSRRAHRRDGAALTRFLCWLSQEAPKRARDGNPVTESEAAERLAALRAEQESFRDLSFDTISGAGPNGAIVHYRVSEKSDRALGLGELFLLDSGGQYLDGTTDVTRTIAIGEPSAEMRERFTRVLKGHIALARARFPKGTSGSQLDSLARLPLWEAGLDYDHGTGHGVGSFLSVHEGPQRISKVPNTVALEPGMIVSNEPGYYKTGAYGIRIENLVAVVEADVAGEKPMLGFETLTLAPIDQTLIDRSLLSPAEIAWLDAYHARVRETHAPRLDKETAAWLAEATKPLGG